MNGEGAFAPARLDRDANSTSPAIADSSDRRCGGTYAPKDSPTSSGVRRRSRSEEPGRGVRVLERDETALRRDCGGIARMTRGEILLAAFACYGTSRFEFRGECLFLTSHFCQWTDVPPRLRC